MACSTLENSKKQDKKSLRSAKPQQYSRTIASTEPMEEDLYEGLPEINMDEITREDEGNVFLGMCEVPPEKRQILNDSALSEYGCHLDFNMQNYTFYGSGTGTSVLKTDALKSCQKIYPQAVCGSVIENNSCGVARGFSSKGIQATCECFQTGPNDKCQGGSSTHIIQGRKASSMIQEAMNLCLSKYVALPPDQQLPKVFPVCSFTFIH